MKTVALLLILGLFALKAPAAEQVTVLRSYADAIAMIKEHKVPGLLIFSAEWCGPCQKMKRETFDSLVPKLRSTYVVYNVDIDKEPEVTARWRKIGGISSVPAYAIINNKGTVVAVYGEGYKSRQEFIKWMNDGIDSWNKERQPQQPQPQPQPSPGGG
jgi:thioredoxin-like negative regulator of GroEL